VLTVRVEVWQAGIGGLPAERLLAQDCPAGHDVVDGAAMDWERSHGGRAGP